MAGVSYCYLTVVLVYIFIRLTLLRISFRCIRLRILTSDDARVFKELPQLISNSIHLHFGRSFVMESTSFPFFSVPDKEEPHAVFWDNIRYQGFFGDRTELENLIDSRVVGLLHWEVKNVF